MRAFVSLLVILFVTFPSSVLSEVKSFYGLSATDASGKEVEFEQFAGKVILVVNIHSRCGTTPQLAGLQELYDKYKEKGLVVLGFPSEDFAALHSSEDQEVETFCRKKFDVDFPIYSRAVVTGDNKDDVFKFLTQTSPEKFQGDIVFNFEKFLIGRDGQLKERYGSFTGPTSGRLVRDIEAELDA